ncbi:aspartyl-phosphate phosphatase Spo0E family protein [Bacillus seohaeanensis]|jgi:hypothetical protein|uniref:Aspartyl-phosphate phosphatase Spo0E family protein n=1 Tax=Bacillus seohaeanensis TaxID=284580 RepID=A0ABW5RQD6_9BACI
MKCLVFTVLVEKSREKLVYVSKRYGLTSKETIQASQQLDQILNLSSNQLIEK